MLDARWKTTTNQRMHAESSSVSWAMVAQPLGPGDPGRSAIENDFASQSHGLQHLIRDAYSGLLFIGDAISARDLKQIYDHQFSAVLDLAANEPPAVLGRDIIYCRFPMSDDDSNHDAMISSAIVCLHSLIERDYRTLVACSAGMSRSPLIAAAAISLLSGDTLADCLTRITTNAPHDVSPTLLSSVNRVHAKLSA